MPRGCPNSPRGPTLPGSSENHWLIRVLARPPGPRRPRAANLGRYNSLVKACRPAIRLLLLAVLLASPLQAADPAPDWPAWFAKNTVVTDKKSYVHFFWNANDVKDRFSTQCK